jgi:hypothetical protein
MLANVQSCGREGCSCENENENKRNEMRTDSDDVCQVTASQKSEVTSQKVPKLSSTSHLNSVTPLSLRYLIDCCMCLEIEHSRSH